MPSQDQRKHEDIMSYLLRIRKINDTPNRTVDDIRKRNELEDELFEIVKDHPDRFSYIRESNCPRLLAKLLEQEDMPPETEAPEPSPALPEYFILHRGKQWIVHWKNVEYESGYNAGWRYIVHCMKYPKMKFKAIELYKAIHPEVGLSTSQDRQLQEMFHSGEINVNTERPKVYEAPLKKSSAKHFLKTVKEQIQELEKDIEKAIDEGQDADYLRSEKEDLEEQLLEYEQKGHLKVFRDDESRMHDSISQAMGRAIKNIDHLEIFRHFSDAFGRINSAKKCYNPKEPIPWKLP